MARFKRHLKVLQAIFLLLGVGVFVYLIYSVGVNEILDSIRLVGYGFIGLAVISAFRYIFRSLAWLYCIEAKQRKISLLALFNARLAGDALRLLSFTGPFLGEPSKAYLVRDRLPMKYGVPSIVVENLCFMLTGIFVIISGLFLLVANFTLENSIKLMGFVVCALIILTVFAVNYVISRRIKAVASGVGWLSKKTGIAWLNEQKPGIAETEDKIHEFYNRRGAVLFLVLALEIGAHFINIAEVYLILYLINVDVSLMIAYIIEAVGKVVSVVFFFVPGQVGVTEGSSAFLLQILGLGFATGITLALVEKVRMIFWIAYGLVIWVIAFKKKAKQAAQDQSSLPNRTQT